MKTPKTQKETLLTAMLRGRVITCLDGLTMCGCLNVRNRICEIIDEGKYKITKGWKVTKSKKRVRTYAIVL